MSFRNFYTPYLSITTECIRRNLELHTWIPVNTRIFKILG